MAKKQTVQDVLLDPQESAFRKYRKFVVGNSNLYSLIKYELITSLSSLPGALGLFLRKKLYPFLIKNIGRNVVFGENVVIRNPQRIKIGDNILIDDNCLLDARGGKGEGIIIGNNVLIGRNAILSMKEGTIEIGDNTNIGVNCVLHTSSQVMVGKNVIVGAYTYLVGGGTHSLERTDIPIISQGIVSKGGIVVEDNVWLGAGVKILDGVKIGRDSVIGASSLVTENVPEFVIAYGIPAKVVKKRK